MPEFERKLFQLSFFFIILSFELLNKTKGNEKPSATQWL